MPRSGGEAGPESAGPAGADVVRALRRLRLASGRSFRDLEAVSGISDDQLRRYELGLAQPNLAQIARLARVYGISPEAVLTPQEGDDAAPWEVIATRLQLGPRDRALLEELAVSVEDRDLGTGELCILWLWHRYALSGPR